MYFATAFVALLTVVNMATATVPWKPCAGVAARGTINSVAFTPSCADSGCDFRHNTTTHITVNFTPSESGDYAKTAVFGMISFLPVPFPIPEDACANNNMKCPFVANQPVVYTNEVFVQPSYPKIRLAVKWQLLDRQNNNLICILFPATIVD